MPMKDRIIITILMACGLLCAAGMLKAEDRTQERKLTAQYFKAQQKVEAEDAKRGDIVAKFAVFCKGQDKALQMKPTGDLGCVAPPPMLPARPEPPKPTPATSDKDKDK